MSAPNPDRYDVIVIGAGPPGENAADYAVKGGLTAALVESELVGGECSYWACMPSKALLRPVELLDAAKAVPGITVGDHLDLAPVLERRDSFTSHHDDSSQVEWAQGAGITVVRGHARIIGEKRVEVTGADGESRALVANEAVVLASGSSAAIPDIDGLADSDPWTSRDVTNLKEVPARVVVIGGGVVGCEATTWLCGLGAAVTLLSTADRLLPRNEPFAGELVRAKLAEAGVDIRFGVSVTGVHRSAAATHEVGQPRGGEVTVSLSDGQIVADEVVVATGRTPNSTDVGLDTVGLTAKGYVETDDTMLVKGVNGQWLYAVGDVTGRALLTHMGKYQGRVCGDVISARAKRDSTDAPRFHDVADDGMVPQVTFTDPRVASVGLSEAEARDAGHDVRTVDYDLGNVSGAVLLRDDYTGTAKLVINRATQTLLGATFAGEEVAELLHSATVAIVGGVTLDQLWHAVPSYPTMSEVWLRLLETMRAEDSASSSDGGG